MLCKLCIWDTVGQEKYKSLNSAYYRGANGALIVYNICDSSEYSQAKIKNWVKELRNHTQPEMPIVLVGNKYDLLGEYDEEIIKVMQKFAKSIMCFHNVCSAKTDFNIEVIFSLLITKMYQNHQKETE